MRRLLSAAALVLALSPALRAAGLTRVSSGTFSAPGGDDVALGFAHGGSYDYVVGASSQGPQGRNIWVARLDPLGHFISSVTFNGPANGSDEGQGVVYDPGSGSVFVVGNSSTPAGSALWVGKFNAALAFISSATFAGIPVIGNTSQRQGLILSGGSLVTVNTTLAAGHQELLLAKIDLTTLAIVSSTTYNRGNTNLSTGYDVAADGAGNLFVAGGAAAALGQSTDFWVAKFGPSLAFLTDVLVGGAAAQTDAALAVAVSSGEVYAGGYMINAGVTNDIFLAHYTPSLVQIDSATIASPFAGHAQIKSLVATGQRLYAAGFINTSGGGGDVYLAELAHNLTLLSSDQFDGGLSLPDVGTDLAIDPANGAAEIAGSVQAPGNKAFLGKWSLPGLPPISTVTFPVSGVLSTLPIISGTAQAQALFSSSPTITGVDLVLKDVSLGQYYDGVSWTVGQVFLSSLYVGASSGAFTYTPPALTNGHQYEVQSRAADDQGGQQPLPPPASFLYDTDAPVAAATAPVAGQTFFGKFPGVAGTAADPTSSVVSVMVRISSAPSFGTCWSGAAWTACPASVPGLVSGGAWSVPVAALPSPGSLQSGVGYRVQVQALDAAGNLSGFGSPADFLYLSAVNSGNFASGASRIAGSGTQDLGLNPVVDLSNPGNPVYYEVLLTTPDPTLSGFYAEAIARFDSSGVMTAIQGIPGNTGDVSLAVDQSGYLFAAYKSSGSFGTKITLEHYDPSFQPMGRVDLDTQLVGNISDLEFINGTLYAAADGGDVENHAKLIQFSGGSLMAIATATYTGGSGSVDDAYSIAGNSFAIYAAVGSSQSSERRLLAYDTNLSGQLGDTDVSTLLPTSPSVAVSTDGTRVYAAAYDPSGLSVYVRAFDSAAQYQNFGSTSTGALSPFMDFAQQLKVSPAGDVFLGYTNAYDGTAYPGRGDFQVIKFDRDLRFLNSRNFNGVAGSTDVAYGLAVADSSDVVIGGATWNGTDYDAALARFFIPAVTGGQLTAAAVNLAPPFLGPNGSDVPMLRLDLVGQNGPVTVDSLHPVINGNAPGGNVTVNLWSDANGDGVFQSTVDVRLSTGVFATGVPPQATLALGASMTPATQYYFITVSFGSLTAANQLGLSFPGPGFFGLSQGFVAGGIPFPLQSGVAPVQQALYANPLQGNYSVPFGGAAPGGGFDTGLFVQTGQNVQVGASGSWDAGGFGVVTATGTASTGGLGGALPLGALVGRFGGGQWFAIGSSATVTASQPGDLFLAMNDTYYYDNAGQLSISAQVQVSTVAKVWTGASGINLNASVNANWQNGLPPLPGDKVVFDGAVSNASCNWDIYGANLFLLKTNSNYTGTVTIAPAASQLAVSHDLEVDGGRLGLSGGVTVSVQQAVKVRGGVFDMGAGGATLQAGQFGVYVDNGGQFLDQGATANTVRALTPGAFYPFQVWNGSLKLANAAQTSVTDTSGIYISSQAALTQFSKVAFTNTFLSQTPSIRFGPAANPALGAAFSLSGVSFDVNVSTNVDASQLSATSTVTVLNASGAHFGSPYHNDPNRVIKWQPDGGSIGQVSGTISYVGPAPGPVYLAFSAVANSSDGQAFFAALPGAQTTIALSTTTGPFTINLPAPNTYYLLAWKTANADAKPSGFDPIGGYSQTGLAKASPLYIPAGGTVSGAAITLKTWSAVSGVVSNSSSQFGPVVVEAWNGVPHVGDPVSRVVLPNLPQGTAEPYELRVPPDDGSVLGAGQLYVQGFVDVNGDGDQEPFEAQDTFASASANAGSTTTPVNLNIAGGGTAPGGVVTVATANPFTLHGGAVGYRPGSLAQGMLRLDLATSVDSATLNALRVDLSVPAPAGGLYVKVFRDVNADGTFQNPDLDPPPSDPMIGLSFIPAGASSGVVVASNPEELRPSTTATFFVAVDLLGQPYAPFSVSIATESYFTLSRGVMAPLPAHPIATSAATPKFVIPANVAAHSDDSGGVDTGILLDDGLSVTVSGITGLWKPDGSTQVDAGGSPGTTGLATLAPDANYGQLIGRIGDAAGSFTSDWFPVADGAPILSGLRGRLFLAINDFEGAYFDNAGAVLAQFSVSGSTTGAIAGTIGYTSGVGTSLTVTANATDPACPNCPHRPLNPVASQAIPLSAATSYPYEFDGLPAGRPYVITAEVAGQPQYFGDTGNAVFVTAGSTETGVDFSLSQGSGSLSGTLLYSGVQPFGDYTLVVATTTQFDDDTYFYGILTTPTASAFTLTGLPTPATYYALAFRDVNGDDRPDGPEPFGVYGNSAGAFSDLSTLMAPIYLAPGAGASGQNVTLLDRGAVEGGVELSDASGPADIVVLLGHGQPGTPEYTLEDEQIYVLPSGAAAGDIYGYSVELLRPATDYTVFAFLSTDFSDVFTPGDAFGLAPVPPVPAGGFTHADVVVHGSQPPAAVSGFAGQAPSSSTVVWSWTPLPGAAGYELLTATGGVLVSPDPRFSVYPDALPANSSSSITGIRAFNGFGTGPAVSVAPVYTLADVPGQPAVSAFVSSAAVSWTAGGNPPGTLYQLARATAAAGPYTVVLATANLAAYDPGLVPAAQYYWEVAAVNGNGLVSAFSSTQTATTSAPSGPAVTGLITYGGRQPGLLVIQASTTPFMSPVAASVKLPNAPAQSYFLTVPPGAFYYVRAFVDLYGDGQDHGGAATVLPSTANVTTSPYGGVDLALPGDNLAPSFPVGLSVATPFGQDQLTWTAPATDANGTPISDLAGFRVYRATLPAGPFAAISSGTVFASTAAIPYPPTSFNDLAPVANAVNYYRVTALDFDGNESVPSAAAGATPFFGGTISGTVQDFGSSADGPLRVRLSTTPFGSSFIAESTLNPFSFTNLPDAVYYVKAFRDANGDGKQQDNEAAGTLGGLAQPYQQQIINGSSISGTEVNVCDRPSASFGQGAPAFHPVTISAAGCPALDVGEGHFTSLLGFTVGGGGAGSVGLGANLFIQMQSAFPNRLLILGPDGNVAADDSNAGGASISFSPTRPGRYLIEPTSFNPFDAGSSTISLSVSGGFSGAVAGTLSYSGSQNTGPFVVQLFTSPDPTSYPIFQSTFAAGAYSLGGLPDGTYYVRAYRDANGNFAHDTGEPAGVFGVSASSLTAITVQGGVERVGTSAGAAVNVTLTDPAVGTVAGTLFRQGTQAGTIRIVVGPPGSGGNDVSPVAVATVAAAGAYSVSFIPPATNYIVEAWVDVNGDSHVDPLEARGSSQPITVQANQTTSVNLLVADPGSGSAGNATLQGSVFYSGASTGPLMIGFATDAQFQNVAYVLTQASTGAYLKTGVVGDTSYYIAAFLDSNNNSEPDDSRGEPIGFYGAAPSNDFKSKQPVFVPNAGAVTANVTMADGPTGSIVGQVTYNGSAPLSQALVVRADVQSGGGNFTSQRTSIARTAGQATYGFTLPYLAAASNYNVSAFVDANGNGNPDFGEPFAQYGQTFCSGSGPCLGAAVAVSSGPGTFPAYGVNLTVQDPGSQSGALANTGFISVDGSYLGSQSGPMIVRAFTNAAMSGTPFATLAIPMPPGPGDFLGTFTNVPFGDYYIDAFRDPSNTGVFNPAFDAYGTFDSVSLSANRNYGHTNTSQGVVDPGQGGSVNVYNGDFSKPGGARFDGGSVDIGAGVALDSFTAGGPYPFVLGLTKQNQGLLASMVKYSSSGVFMASATIQGGDNGITGFAVDSGGNVFLGGEQRAPGSNVSSGTLVKFGPGLAPAGTVVISSNTNVRNVVYAGGSVYVALEGHQSGNYNVVLKYDPATLTQQAAGSFSFPQAAFPGCSGPDCLRGSGQALAVDASGNVYVLVNGGGNGGGASIYELLKFAPGLGAVTAQADVTPLVAGPGSSHSEVSMGTDASGNLFLALTPSGDSFARTYKFSPSLQRLASAVFGPVVSHFGGGLRNMVVGSDGYVYEAWETGANGGDMAALRYDPNLALVSSRTFDGLDNAHEDFAFGIDVADASHVYLTGGATNANGNLDWATVRLDLTSSGAQSGAGQAVVISTANAVNAVFGTLTYAGALQSSGTVRAVLLPLGQSTPIRVSSAAFGASTPYLFNNVPPGVYQVQAFVDGNNNFLPEAGEAVAFSSSTGFQFLGGTSRRQDLALCDRRPIAFGQTVAATITPADCPGFDRAGAYARLYTFAGARGQAVTVTNAAVNFVDSALSLYDQSFHLVAVGDDSGADANARIKDVVLPADGLYTVAASPFAAGLSSATVNLTLGGSAGSLGSIAGTVGYTGVQGGQIVMGLFSTSTFLSGSGANPVQVLTVPGPGSFSFSGLASGSTYYLGGFVDVNANRQPDNGEDIGFFGSTVTGPAAVYLRSGQNVTGLAFTISPQSTSTLADVGGLVSYSGARTGTLHVEFWPGSSFTGQPAATRLVPTGAGPYDVLVRGGLPYYVRAWLDANGNFLLDPDEPSGVYAPHNQGAEAVFAPSTGTLSGVNLAIADPGARSGGVVGEGTAAIAPSTAAAGAVFVATITYTAGSNGVAANGRVGFTLPPGFPPPQASQITVTNDAGASLALSTTNLSAFVTVNTGSIANGQHIYFRYSGGPASCQVSTQTLIVTEAQNGAVPPQPLLAGSPSLRVVQGPPAQFQPSNPYLSLTQGALSDPQTLVARDLCGNQAPVTAAQGARTVTLRAKRFDFTTGQFVPDATVGVSSGAFLSTASAMDFGFAVGKSSAAFYAVSSSTGAKNIEVFFKLGAPTTFYYGLTALPNNALTGVNVSSVSFAAGGSSTTIAPAGGASQAYVNFTLGDPNQSWHVLVSSKPFRAGTTPTPLWESWGYGQPNKGQISWDGRYSPWINGGARVPSGSYYVRVEVAGGGVHDDSLLIAVVIPQVAGKFLDAGQTPNPPLAGANVQVYGPNGTSATQSDSAGAYVLPGLAAGVYNMFVSRQDFLDANLSFTVNAAGSVSTFTALTPTVTASTNASGGIDLAMTRAAVLVVTAQPAASYAAQAGDQWGSLQVNTSTSIAASLQRSFFLPLRLPSGTTTFDDGGQWDSSSQQFLFHTLFKFTVAPGSYTVTASMPGFSPSTAAVYVTQGLNSLALPALSRKSSISGTVALPAGFNPNGAFVSVNAVPLSTAAAASGGGTGVQLAPGVLSAPYRVDNLPAGSYLLRANANGLAVVSTGPISVPASSDVAHVDFSTFSAGASIAGTVTFNADTSGDNLDVQVSACSPGALNFGSTDVFVAGGVAGLAVPYAIKGLSAGATYQVYVNVGGHNGARLEPVGQLPLQVAAPSAAANVSFTVSSGVISGTILLPAGNTDFLNVSLVGQTIASAQHPDDVGHVFTVPDATQLPNFQCFPAGAVVAGACPVGSSTGTFTVQNQGTETDDITLYYKTTGQAKKFRLSTVNGSTTTVFVDLSPQTYSISGSIDNQITNALFNTNPKIVANAPLVAPQGYPAGISSTTARVVAIKQDLSQYNVAISTVFDPVSSRVGFLTAAGTWTVSNVPSGVYYVRTADLRSCATCDILVPRVGQLVNVAGAGVSAVTLALTDGYSVSGSISLDGGLQDSRVFDVTVLNQRQEVARSTTVYLGDAALGVTANSVDYSFTNLPAGDFYTLLVSGRNHPHKYVGRPLRFPNPGLSPNGLQSNLSAQNVVLQVAAYLTGRMQDSNTGELIGANNASLLAPNFQVSATASPWVEGGFAVAASSISGRPIQGDGAFLVGPLIPNVSYALKLGQLSWDPSFLANGSQNYTPVTLSGLTPQPGQILDVGVVALNQGQSLTGTVRASTSTGAGLGNILVTAKPSFGGTDLLVQTYTNQFGKYTLWVSTYVSNQFDVTAAPRGGNTATDGKVYGQVTLRNVNLLATTTADFILNPLLVTVTGQVVVADAGTGGQLGYPFGDQKGFPAAAVFLQRQGVVPQTNPLGDIQENTDSLGSFSVPGLSTGSYNLRAVSLGYSVFNATVTASTSTYVIYTDSFTPANYLSGNKITLQRGATVTGRIVKSDGTAPNASEVGGVAAANFASGEFLVGTVDLNKTAKTVNSYTISGFKPGVSYNLVILPADKGEVIAPPEGAGISFLPSEASATKNVNLTYASPSFQCVATAKALGSQQFQVKIDCNKDLRNQLSGDNDLSQILTVSTYTSAGTALTAPNGTGTMNGGDKKISGDRKQITAIYAAAAGETQFSLRLKAAAASVDAKTGTNFTTDQVFDFYAGLTSNVKDRISNINGGSIQLQPSVQDELLGVDEKSRIDLRPGTFAEGADSLLDSQVVASATSTIVVGIAKAKDLNSASVQALHAMGYVPSSLNVLGNPSAFPPELAAAMGKAGVLGASTATITGVNPISSFYSIFLPLGIRHQLKERADLTFSYDTSASTSAVDPNNINVWWYDSVNGKYVLENTDRRIDANNKTITVSVNHFSVFVVLNGAPSITIATPGLGPELLGFNFPNPSDCIVHSNITRDTRTGVGAGTLFAPFTGTMVRFTTPAGDSAGAAIRIYNLAGELVRSFDQGTIAGDTTAYTPWDCNNNSGHPVASGVYIGEIQWGKHHKFFKIAIVRGSGL